MVLLFWRKLNHLAAGLVQQHSWVVLHFVLRHMLPVQWSKPVVYCYHVQVPVVAVGVEGVLDPFVFELLGKLTVRVVHQHQVVSVVILLHSIVHKLPCSVVLKTD